MARVARRARGLGPASEGRCASEDPRIRAPRAAGPLAAHTAGVRRGRDGYHPSRPQGAVRRGGRGRLRLLATARRKVPGERLPPARLDQHRAPQAPLRRPHVRRDGPARRRTPALGRIAWARPRHGADRLGQDDDALRDDRAPEPHEAGPHSDDRGSDRSAVQGRSGFDRPAGGGQRHRKASCPRSARRCDRTPT